MNATLLTFADLQKKADTQKKLHNHIKDNTFIFDSSTTDYEFVDLSYNENLQKIEFRSQQPKLKYLKIYQSPVQKIVFSSDCCPALLRLEIQRTELKEINFTTIFHKLELLDISHNEELENVIIPETNFPFPALKYLFTSYTAIKDLSPFAQFFVKEDIDFVIIKMSALVNPPEAIVEQGNEAVQEYYRQFLKDKRKGKEQEYLYEAKLLILGDPGAGKTTLARKLLNFNANLPKEEETTRGVELEVWKYKYIFTGKGEREMSVNIWDFGGQAIYKHTHRFFLTQRSLYILLGDARSETGANRGTDFEYWLYMIKAFGGDSPVILFINEKEDRKLDIHFREYQRINPALREEVSINLKHAGGRDKEKFAKIVDTIKNAIAGLKHIGEPVPASWKDVRDEIKKLEEQGKRILEKEEYFALCRRFGISDEDTIKTLAGYFNDIGVFLSFFHDDYADLTIKNKIFIDKQWILNAAYKLIDSPAANNKNGKLTQRDFEEIFSVKDYESFIPQIKALLKRFFIIYERDTFIIVPQLLSVGEISNEAIRKENYPVKFIYKYENYMPVGILWQLIVELNKYIKADEVWRNKVVFSFDNNTEVVVIEDYKNKKIEILARGNDAAGRRSFIMGEIERINNSFEDLTVKKKVPCVCDECVRSESPEYYDYEKLIKLRYQKGQETITCLESGNQVPISKLLEGIEIYKPDRMEKRNSIIIQGNNNTVIQDGENVEYNRQSKNLGNNNKQSENSGNDNQQKNKPDEPEKKKSNTIWVIVAVVFILLAVGLFFFYKPDNSTVKKIMDIAKILSLGMGIILGLYSIYKGK